MLDDQTSVRVHVLPWGLEPEDLGDDALRSTART
jgi:hypothetical protein